MAGSALAVGSVAVVATLLVGFAGAGVAAATSARVSGAADAAALAAADTASGRVVGVPCEHAASAARLGGADLASCAVDGLVATVEVSAPFGAFTARARARAGPPPSG
ncbi:helicase [Microbacterium dauci]|uniref:Helicase n=1 Tax=Microbacterium dauci TaxID=3048008 RepID=A0ABT6ZFD8_9MICO|nr:helicase [Microbacterium sp. LX3-4]MDJ1114878.1 helicase [Microbacterium sp. LX3-4]